MMYTYFVVYRFQTPTSHGWGNNMIYVNERITDLEPIRVAERNLAKSCFEGREGVQVVITNFILLSQGE